MTRHLRSLILLCIPVMFCAPGATRAELVRFEVVEIESPAFDGRSFGSVGQYEMITARATLYSSKILSLTIDHRCLGSNRNFKVHLSLSLSLQDNCARADLAANGDIRYTQLQQIASSEFAIDCQVE